MSKPFDATGKDLLETDPAGWVTFLGYPTTSDHAVLIDADVSTVTSDADKVIRVALPSPWLLHVELQASRDENLPWRLLQYNAILQHRHRVPVATAVFLLRPAANASNLTGTWTVETPVAPEWQFRYHVVRLWEESADNFLEGPLGLLPFSPLANIREADLPVVVDRMKKRLQRPVPQSLKAKVWSAAYILMGMRYNVALIRDVLAGVLDMEESVTYQEILQRGLKAGRKEGEKLGVKLGQERGKLLEARRILLRMGTKKFGPPSTKNKTALNAIPSVQRIEDLSVRILETDSWNELLDSEFGRAE